MRLQAGDKIWVTKRDSRAPGDNDDFTLIAGALYIEWSGKVFLGCTSLESRRRTSWTLKRMRRFQEEAQTNPAARTDIDCMFEQLEGEGAFA